MADFLFSSTYYTQIYILFFAYNFHLFLFFNDLKSHIDNQHAAFTYRISLQFLLLLILRSFVNKNRISGDIQIFPSISISISTCLTRMSIFFSCALHLSWSTFLVSQECVWEGWGCEAPNIFKIARMLVKKSTILQRS